MGVFLLLFLFVCSSYALFIETKMVADRLGPVLDGNGLQCVEVPAIGRLGTGWRELQRMNADEVEIMISNIAIHSERIVGAFKCDLRGIDRRVVKNGTVLFANGVTDGGCHRALLIEVTCSRRVRRTAELFRPPDGIHGETRNG